MLLTGQARAEKDRETERTKEAEGWIPAKAFLVTLKADSVCDLMPALKVFLSVVMHLFFYFYFFLSSSDQAITC